MNTMTKKELLTIFSKMQKKELLEILQLKYGGNSDIIRTPIKYKENRNKNNNVTNVMKNNNKYNSMYLNENNKK